MSTTNTIIINANVYTGSFTKKDGTQRTMRFLKENAVPNSLRGSGVKPRYLDSTSFYSRIVMSSCLSR